MDTRSSSDMATWACLQCREAQKNMWPNDACEYNCGPAEQAQRSGSSQVHKWETRGRWSTVWRSSSEQDIQVHWNHWNTLKICQEWQLIILYHILICISSLSMATLGQGCDPASRMYQCATLRFTTKLGLDWNWWSWKPDERLPVLAANS